MEYVYIYVLVTIIATLCHFGIKRQKHKQEGGSLKMASIPTIDVTIDSLSEHAFSFFKMLLEQKECMAKFAIAHFTDFSAVQGGFLAKLLDQVDYELTSSGTAYDLRVRRGNSQLEIIFRLERSYPVSVSSAASAQEQF